MRSPDLIVSASCSSIGVSGRRREKRDSLPSKTDGNGIVKSMQSFGATLLIVTLLKQSKINHQQEISAKTFETFTAQEKFHL